jgi:hypothetical protein
LIAREVLRQAAARAGHPAPCLERTAAGVAAASDPSLVRSAEHEIGRYLRSAMHPSAVTDADIRSRYADLSRPRAVAGGAPGDKTPMLPATAQLLRERIQNERFDDELRRLVQRLTDEADIRQ